MASTDANGNGAYDPDEAAADLRVVADRGSAHAVTGQSGGFALPFPPGFGAIRLQLQDASGCVLAERAAEIGADHVKVDFVLAD